MNKEKYYTYKLDMLILNVMATVLIIVLYILSTIFYKKPLYINMNTVILMFLWLILHEIIHAIGFYLKKEVNFKNIIFGIFLEKGVLYCVCKQEIKKKTIMLSLLLPLITIGIITLILGYIIKNETLIILSLVNISGSIGDIMMYIFMKKLPKDIKYLDLDDPTSFTIISEKDIGNIKTLGLKLIDQGIYDKKIMYPKDKKLITITRISKITIIILLLIYILNLIV